MARADCGAAAAGHALVVVNGGEVVQNVDGIVIALALTQVAADAADVADLARQRAALMVGAGDDDVGVVGHRDDDLARADLNALHTAGALIRVHARHTFDDVDGVKLADRNAGAEAKAARGAGRRAVSCDEHGRAAVGDAVIDALGQMVFAAALDHGDGLFDLHGLHAHDLGHFLCSFRTARGAQANGRLAVEHGLRIGAAAGEAAAAAVRTGQRFGQLWQAFVHLDGKDLGGDGEDAAEQRAHHAEHQHGIENFFHIARLLT